MDWWNRLYMSGVVLVEILVALLLLMVLENVCWGWFQTRNHWLERVEKMNEPIYLVNPIIETWGHVRYWGPE